MVSGEIPTQELRVIEKKRLYVGCGLTHASQEFKNEVEELKDELALEWNVLHFLGTAAGTAIDVYQKDIVENVGSCDAFVGVMDEPSWGLGWESREAALLHKPTLLVANVASHITRLALGAPHFTDIRFRRYENMIQDIPGIIREEFINILIPPESPSR